MLRTRVKSRSLPRGGEVSTLVYDTEFWTGWRESPSLLFTGKQRTKWLRLKELKFEAHTLPLHDTEREGSTFLA